MIANWVLIDLRNLVDWPTWESSDPLCHVCGLPLRGHWRRRACLTANVARLVADRKNAQEIASKSRSESGK